MKSLKLISFAILFLYSLNANDPVPSSGFGKELLFLKLVHLNSIGQKEKEL